MYTEDLLQELIERLKAKYGENWQAEYDRIREELMRGEGPSGILMERQDDC